MALHNGFITMDVYASAIEKGIVEAGTFMFRFFHRPSRLLFPNSAASVYPFRV